MTSIYNKIKEQLNEAGLKATHQRMVILDTVLRTEHHPSAENIFDAIHGNNPTISLGTVYKTLETLVEYGLVEKVFTKEGQMRYDPKTDSHGHIYCANTNEIVDYYDDELNQLIVGFFKKKKVSNLKIKNITLQINANKIDPKKDISIK